MQSYRILSGIRFQDFSSYVFDPQTQGLSIAGRSLGGSDSSATSLLVTRVTGPRSSEPEGPLGRGLAKPMLWCGAVYS